MPQTPAAHLRTLVLGAACAAAVFLSAPLRGQAPAAPSIDALIELERVGSPALSGDGQRVAFTVRRTNWADNSYETDLWLAGSTATDARQLTRGPKSSQQPQWAPEHRTLGFISDRDGTRQIYRLDVTGGEAERLTSVKEGVTAFAWAPDGRRLAYTTPGTVSEALKAREERWGDITLEDEDRRYGHLHVLDLGTRASRVLTSGSFVVGAFDWSPDGSHIAFDHRISNDAGDGGSADISVVEVATGSRRPLVTQEGPDTNPRWSPDGQQVAFQTAMAKPFYFFQNGELAVVTATTGAVRSITPTFDEDPSLIGWTTAGVFFSASQRTETGLFVVDPATRTIRRVPAPAGLIANQFSVSQDGAQVAYVGASPTGFPDVYRAQASTLLRAERLSNAHRQIADWPAHRREVIRWKSQDGTEIEGVLHVPATAAPGTRHPLLVVIHGGPTGVSRPQPYASASFYPIDGFLARGALVLEPNYRGSAGYGEAFRSLNVRNLGIGDAWDVLSGIDALVQQGRVDPARVGSMGWSQGGYISAFLTTRHADRFRAISVGAGISDWMTYYVNTDIHPFTRQYLKATPWDDPKIYADTSPMTYIRQARTPTLIQHGDQDPRVPVPNAFQLYQGLRDQNVPVRLALFKGFGHGLTRPKANRAAMEQNWAFFGTHIWGDAPREP